MCADQRVVQLQLCRWFQGQTVWAMLVWPHLFIHKHANTNQWIPYRFDLNLSLFIIVLVYYLCIVPPPKHQNLYFTKVILKSVWKKDNLSFHKCKILTIFSSFAYNKIFSQLHLLYISVQIVSEYLTHALAFTLKQRVCLCGRTVSTIICKCLLSGYVYCPVLLQSNPEVVSFLLSTCFHP